MSNGKPFIKISDFTKAFEDVIQTLRDDETLVGIPREDAARDVNDPDQQTGPINNAALLFINEFGSPVNNIPARPAMATGIAKVQDKIALEFKKAADAALSKGAAAMGNYQERVGMIASNSIKQVITTNEGLLPPSESTIRGRQAKGFKGTKALLVTGQMRNAITYVVRRK